MAAKIWLFFFLILFAFVSSSSSRSLPSGKLIVSYSGCGDPDKTIAEARAGVNVSTIILI